MYRNVGRQLRELYLVGEKMTVVGKKKHCILKIFCVLRGFFEMFSSCVCVCVCVLNLKN